MARKSNPVSRPQKKELHRCGDCANVTEVLEPSQLLSLEGKPTLGTCPYWKQSRCTLLSWRSDCKHFKPKQSNGQAPHP